MYIYLYLICICEEGVQMLRVWCVEEAGAGGGDRQSSHHNSRPTSSSPHTAPPLPLFPLSSILVQHNLLLPYESPESKRVGFKLLSQGPQEDFWRRDFGWKLIFRIYSISSLFSTVNSPHQLLSQRNVFRIPPNTAEDKSTSIFTSSAAPHLKPYGTPLPSFPDPLLSRHQNLESYITMRWFGYNINVHKACWPFGSDGVFQSGYINIF